MIDNKSIRHLYLKLLITPCLGQRVPFCHVKWRSLAKDNMLSWDLWQSFYQKHRQKHWSKSHLYGSLGFELQRKGVATSTEYSGFMSQDFSKRYKYSREVYNILPSTPFMDYCVNIGIQAVSWSWRSCRSCANKFVLAATDHSVTEYVCKGVHIEMIEMWWMKNKANISLEGNHPSAHRPSFFLQLLQILRHRTGSNI